MPPPGEEKIEFTPSPELETMLRNLRFHSGLLEEMTKGPKTHRVGRRYPATPKPPKAGTPGGAKLPVGEAALLAGLKKEKAATKGQKPPSPEQMAKNISQLADQSSQMWRALRTVTAGLKDIEQSFERLLRSLGESERRGRKTRKPMVEVSPPPTPKPKTEAAPPPATPKPTPTPASAKSASSAFLAQLYGAFRQLVASASATKAPPAAGGGGPAGGGVGALGAAGALVGGFKLAFNALRVIAEAPETMRKILDTSMKWHMQLRFGRHVAMGEPVEPMANLMRRLEATTTLAHRERASMEDFRKLQEGQLRRMKDPMLAKAPWDFARAGGAGIFLRRGLALQGQGVGGGIGLRREEDIRFIDQNQQQWRRRNIFSGKGREIGGQRVGGERASELEKLRGVDQDEAWAEGGGPGLGVSPERDQAMKALGQWVLSRFNENLDGVMNPQKIMDELSRSLDEMMNRMMFPPGGS